MELPKFFGKISKLENFIAKCELAFDLHPSTFRNNHTKVLFVLGHLVDSAFQWACPITKNPLHPLCFDYPAFKSQLEAVYHNNTFRINFIIRLRCLRYTRSVAEYASEFLTIMNLPDYGENAMYGQFYPGLKPKIQNALGTTGLSQTFSALCDKVVEINQVSFSIGLCFCRCRLCTSSLPRTTKCFCYLFRKLPPSEPPDTGILRHINLSISLSTDILSVSTLLYVPISINLSQGQNDTSFEPVEPTKCSIPGLIDSVFSLNIIYDHVVKQHHLE